MQVSEVYGRHLRKKRARLFLIGLLVLFASLVSLAIGAYSMTAPEAFMTLVGFSETPQQSVVLFNLRLPRVTAALIAGAGLSASGCVMQTGLRNPLASPSTLGVSAAAIFGANVSIILLLGESSGYGGAFYAPYLTTATAFFFAMVSTLLILSLSRLRGFSPQALILAGVALNTLFNAMTVIIQYFADETELSRAVFWTFGDLSRAGWNEIWILGVVVLISLIHFYRRRLDYNTLSNGDDTARSLGVDAKRVRFTSLFIAAAVTAVSVSFLGLISFIGLLGPHIMRRIVGNDHRFLLVGSILLGSLILLLADILSRSVMAPIVLPVGAVTSLLGAPLFLTILLKGGMRHAR